MPVLAGWWSKNWVVTVSLLHNFIWRNVLNEWLSRTFLFATQREVFRSIRKYHPPRATSAPPVKPVAAVEMDFRDAKKVCPWFPLPHLYLSPQGFVSIRQFTCLPFGPEGWPERVYLSTYPAISSPTFIYLRRRLFHHHCNLDGWWLMEVEVEKGAGIVSTCKVSGNWKG